MISHRSESTQKSYFADTWRTPGATDSWKRTFTRSCELCQCSYFCSSAEGSPGSPGLADAMDGAQPEEVVMKATRVDPLKLEH